MDWRYTHFLGEQVYDQPRDQVLKEALGLITETSRWTIEETADGFRASAIDFGHSASATFQVSSTDGSTKLSVDLAVKRRGLEGLMLFDVGGYYSSEIRHWLEGVGDRLQGRVGAAAPHREPTARGRIFGCLVGFALIGGGLLFLWIFVIGPIIGLVFGVLYLPGHDGDTTLHGSWARGVSAAIMALDVVLYLRWRSWSRRAVR